MRVQCGTCHRRIWTRLWCRHERRKHAGYAPQAHIPQMEEHMNNAMSSALPTDAKLIGVAACSEAEPQCLAVAYKPNGDLVLANHLGAMLVVPAGEVDQALALAVAGRKQ